MTQPQAKRLVTEQTLLTPGHPPADALAALYARITVDPDDGSLVAVVG